jgi:hypothetical protein
MLHFDQTVFGADLRIEEISWAPIPYKRPRVAGKNARLDVHGWGGDVPVAVVKAGGTEGFGWCTLPRFLADRLIGIPFRALFDENAMLRKDFRGLEFPLLDWLGNYFHKPVYELAAKDPEKVKNGFSAPVYDTTIYFDELHISDNKEAVNFILNVMVPSLLTVAFTVVTVGGAHVTVIVSRASS